MPWQVSSVVRLLAGGSGSGAVPLAVRSWPSRRAGSGGKCTADDLAAAYKQLLQVERGWRDMKGALGQRPVFHHREDRIRAHVQLCWLAPTDPRGRERHRRHLAQGAT